jgi:hypothetical protein
MKSLKFLFLVALMAMSVIIVKAQTLSNINDATFFKAKYKKDKVWDVQRSPAYPVAGQDWTLSGLKGSLDASGSSVDWGQDRYVMLFAEVDNSNDANSLINDVNSGGGKYKVSLRLFESNGTLVKVISKWGKIAGIGEKGFMYECEGHYGTFFSVAAVPANTVVTYKPTLAVISKLSEIINSSPLTRSLEKANGISESSFFSNKYTKENVWDVQRSPAYPVAKQEWTLSGLKGSLDANRANVEWGNGRYVMLIAEVDNTNNPNSITDDINNTGTKLNISLKLYESNGALVKVISKWGKIYGIGAEGFMYEVEGKYGTFFSVARVNASDVIKYKPNLATISKLSELTKGLNSVNGSDVSKINTINSNTQIVTGYYTLTAKCSGKVLDVLDASKADGATIQQWNLNGNIAQHWKIEPVNGAPGYYILTAKCSGKVLDVLNASKLDGATIQQWKLNGNTAQHWKIEPVPGAPGYFTLISRSSGKALDVQGASANAGAKIQQWSANGSAAQQWKLDQVN